MQSEPLTIVIGNFDGIHVGHKELIKTALTFTDTKHAAMTFNPHPIAFFTNDFSHLSSLDDKINEFVKCNFDYFFGITFNKEFSSLDVKEFVDFLRQINVKRIILGDDFRFGKNGIGNPSKLSEYFEVLVIPYLLIENTKVSSSNIRDLVTVGDMQTAKLMLGNDYFINGVVVHGNEIGRILGFKTANIDFNYYLLPKNGVYATKIEMNNNIYYGMANIGNSPTVNFSNEKRLEVNIFDFDFDIYNCPIKVSFLKFIREEKKFKDKHELINNLENDKKEITKLLKKC